MNVGMSNRGHLFLIISILAFYIFLSVHRNLLLVCFQWRLFSVVTEIWELFSNRIYRLKVQVTLLQKYGCVMIAFDYK